MNPRRCTPQWLAFGLLLSLASAAFGQTFDHRHAAWTQLLEDHVRWSADGTASTVDYSGFASDKPRLERYLDTLSAVKEQDFQQWSEAQRQAFLINAYNAFTVALILTRYPDLDSIKDLGGLFSSPWKKSFFDLLGKRRSLDEVEHELLRGAEDFKEPRIHFAVNCASIGCPALRPQAYVAAQLDAQLEDQTERFLRDRSRNRMDGERLAISMIFRWYGEDFAHSGGLNTFLSAHGDALGLNAAQKAALRRNDLKLGYLPYDWQLNAPSTAQKP